MIVGIGTDLVSISRISAAQERTAERFAQRVLGPQELERYPTVALPHQWLAKRWAAKEATAKALGHGIGRGLSMSHIQVLNNDQGAPMLCLSDKALALAEALGADQWHVSLSDEQDHALAFVILSRRLPG